VTHPRQGDPVEQLGPEPAGHPFGEAYSRLIFFQDYSRSCWSLSRKVPADLYWMESLHNWGVALVLVARPAPLWSGWPEFRSRRPDFLAHF
jgi:hypothetical protein